MTGSVRLLALLGAILGIFIHAPSAHAQATRTWVSGVGDDVNPCSRTAPCKTFAGAISKTASGGEINALDPGGFGAVTITKPLTIDGGGGQASSVLASASNGIIVSAGSGTVILRNLRVNGINGTVSPGLNGVVFNTGTNLVVENCEIFGFSQNGILIQPTTGTSHVTIQNTSIYNSGQGAVQAKPTGGTSNVTVDRVRTNSNSWGIGVDTSTGGIVNMLIDTVTASENVTNGVQVSGANSNVQISASTITHNSTGLSISAGDVRSFKNNIIVQNTTNIGGAGTLTTNVLQ